MLDGEMKPLRKLKFVQRKYEDLKDQTNLRLSGPNNKNNGAPPKTSKTLIPLSPVRLQRPYFSPFVYVAQKQADFSDASAVNQ